MMIATIGGAVLGSNCPPPCPVCPDVVPCPTPSCPVPKCPPLPDIPPCPVPRCPSLPEIPTCPNPVLNLSCPNVTCPPHSCPPCPSCPNFPSCPPCSNASAPASGPLPAGYERVPGYGIYKYYDNKVSWTSARTTCASDGAYLVIPDNRNEMDMLLRMLSPRNIYYIHVGFTDIGHEGVFITVLGQPMTSEQKALWGRNEPNGHGHSNCVYINRSLGGLADESCSDRETFMCELPA